MAFQEPHAANIQSLIKEGRGLQMDWFPADVSQSSLAETLVAMANSGGGQVLIGVSPRAGQLQGVQNPNEILDLIFRSALACDPTLVLPVPKRIQIDGKTILWLVVPPGLPNVYSLDGRYLGREAARNVPLTARRLRLLLVERGISSLETRLADDANLADLDDNQVSDYLELLEISPDASWEEVLVQRGCLRKTGGKLIPTYAGLLLFGKNPQMWLPSATILAVRFQGDSLAERFLKKEFSGSLPGQVQQANAFILDQIARRVQVTGLTHQAVPEYPQEAVRELLVNAVAHRDYNLQGDTIHVNLFASRLEISSPGTLPGPMTMDTLLKARFSRNPIVMQVLSDLGFVERIGFGLDRVVAAMRQNQLPAPEFEEFAGSFRVTLRQHDSIPLPAQVSLTQDGELNPRQVEVIRFLVMNKRVTNREYQELCPDVHPETLRRDLADLVQRNLLLKIGDKRATYYVLKRIPEGRL
jgi:ATP-dependent DNA helicase RecG